MASTSRPGGMHRRLISRAFDTSSTLSGSAASDERLQRLERLTELLDDRFRVPVLGWRFGLDSLLGLIPGLGDAAGALVSTYIILEAQRLGVPRKILFRMLSNLGVDALVGAVPVLGDIFDVTWKANRRNVNLLLRHMRNRL